MVLIIGDQGKMIACHFSLLCEKNVIPPAHKDALTATSSDKPGLPLCHRVRNQDAVMPQISW